MAACLMQMPGGTWKKKSEKGGRGAGLLGQQKLLRKASVR